MARDNTILILLLRMLALGLSAWVMINSQDFKEPKLDSQMVTKFLPALMSLMVDDQVCLLIHNADEFQAEDFCMALFDEFFFVGLSRDNVTRHMLKLLWYVQHKLPTSRLHSLVKALQPSHRHSEKNLHNLYKLLQEKIVSQKETDIPPEMGVAILIRR